MKEEFKTLWKNTFGDPDSFLDFFFTHIYKEENVLFYRQENKIIAALHLIPYSMIYHGKELPVSYICGVATVPEERGKGLMFSLMQEAHAVSRQRGDAFTVLIPATSGLFDYYRRMGYRDFFFYESYLYIADERNMNTSECLLSSEDLFTLPELYAFFDSELRKRKTCILHTFEDFFHIIEEMKLSGGCLKVLTDKTEQITGMAFLFPHAENEDRILIKEILYTNKKTKDILLGEIAAITNERQLIVREPADPEDRIPFGMLYPINADVRLPDNDMGFMSLMLE